MDDRDAALNTDSDIRTMLPDAMLHNDAVPVNGRALLVFGAAGKFWAPAHNGPMKFESPAAFHDFTTPGNAKTVARFEAFSEGNKTRLATETIVDVTDPASKPKFAAYRRDSYVAAGLPQSTAQSSGNRPTLPR